MKNRFLDLTHRVLGRLGMGLEMRISKKFPGDADVTDPETTL